LSSFARRDRDHHHGVNASLARRRLLALASDLSAIDQQQVHPMPVGVVAAAGPI